MRTISIVVYEYNELSEEAKAVARNWWHEAGGLDNWWECTYEDAKQVGLKLLSFDLTSASYVHNLDGCFITSATECSEAILSNHGEHSDTYKTAKAFDAVLDALPELPSEDASNYGEIQRDLCESVDTVEADFLDALLRVYTKLLQQQLEYMESEEYTAETLTADGYTFTESGKRFG